jgi:BASS family bile acid:Na+ symporter
MGMILVAACPGGNVSNFISSLAKGNIALSVSLTALATISAIFMTPLNFLLWGSLYSKASELVIPFTIDIWEMLRTVFILLGIPIVLGIWFSKKFPVFTQKITKPIKWISFIIFIGYIVAALSANINYFLMYIHLIFLIVLVHNVLAFLSGYGISALFRLSTVNRRTIAIETGIQNSALGLVLIFNPNLFNGLGGMAFIAAWWGIWHIIAGLTLGTWLSRRPIKD